MNKPTAYSLRFLRHSGLTALAGLTFATLLAQTAPAPSSPNRSAAGPNPSEPPVNLPVFQVNASSEVGYQAANTISATRLNTPLYQVPFSVTVATEDFIRDVAASDFQDTIRYMASAERSFSPTSYGQYNLRGVALGTRGMFLDSRPVLTAVGDSFSIDRVEILKGPASPIAGIATPVGLVNFITKRADPRRSFGNLTLKFGSHEFRRAVIDANLPYTLLGAKSAVRIMAVTHYARTDNPFESTRHRGLTLANTNEFGRNLTSSFSVQFLKLDNVNIGQFAQATVNLPGARGYSPGGWDQNMLDSNGRAIPASLSATGNPGFTTGMFVKDIYDLHNLAGIAGPDNGQFFSETNLQHSLNYQPTDTLSLEVYNSAGREIKWDPRTLGTTQLGFTGVTVTNNVPVLNPAGGRYYETHSMQAFNYPSLWRLYHRISAAYTWNTRYMQQIVRAGWDYQWQTARFQQTLRVRRPGTAADLTIRTFVDDPVSASNNGFQRFADLGGVWTPAVNLKLPREAEAGLFATAQGSYWQNRIHSVVGFRRDTYFYRDWQSYTVPVGKALSDDPLNPSSNLMQRSESPVYSASFEPVKGVNLYYTRAYSFSIAAVGSPILNYKGTINDDPAKAVANGLFDPNNARGPLAPSPTGKGDEFGVKILLLDNRLSANFATFKSRLQNLRVNWPAAFVSQLFGIGNANTAISWTAGGVEQAVKGWEFGLQANPTANLTLSADYSTSDIVFVTNPIQPSAIGLQQTGYYKNMSNLIARYSLPQGPLKGLYVGAASQYRANYYVNVAPNIRNPNIFIINPFIGYPYKLSDRVKMDVRLDITNLTDKLYVTSTIIGARRAGFLSVNFQFK